MKLLNQLEARYNGIEEEILTAQNEYSYREAKLRGKEVVYKLAIELMEDESLQFVYDKISEVDKDVTSSLQVEDAEENILEYKGRQEACGEIMQMLMKEIKKDKAKVIQEVYEDMLNDYKHELDKLNGYDLEEDSEEYFVLQGKVIGMNKSLKGGRKEMEVITMNMLSDLLEIMSRMGYDESYRAGATDTIRALLRLLEGNCHESP